MKASKTTQMMHHPKETALSSAVQLGICLHRINTLELVGGSLSSLQLVAQPLRRSQLVRCRMHVGLQLV